MSGVNKVILVGNLGKDPELKTTPQGKSVCSFPLATSTIKDKSEWHNIVAWEKNAEFAAKYLKKGHSCCIDGRIETRSWDDKDGNKKYRTEIIVERLSFAPGGNKTNESTPQTTPAGFDAPTDDLLF